MKELMLYREGMGEEEPSAEPQPGPSTEPQPGPSTEPQPGPSSDPQPMDVEMVGAGQDDPVFVLIQRGFSSRLLTYRLQRPMGILVTIGEVLALLIASLTELLESALAKHLSIKVNMKLECQFANVHNNTCLRNFKTKMTPLTTTSDLNQFITTAFDKLIREKAECEQIGSGWTYLRVTDLEVGINKYAPLGEDGRAWIPIPESIENTHAIINVLNNDDRCFMYSVLGKLVQQNQNRPASYTPEIIARYDWSGLQFPVALKSIKTFEQNNNTSVNVYGIDHTYMGKKPNGLPKYQDTIFPLRICRQERDDHHDLLYVTTDGASHYACIKDLCRLVSPQITARHGRIFLCKRCFAHFDNRPSKLGLTGAQRLEEHKRYCSAKAPIRMDMPKKTEIKFVHPEFTRRERFTIYADFECALRPTAEMVEQVDQPHGGVATHIHIPYAFAYQIIDSYGLKEFEPRVYFGDDASKTFMEMLKTDVEKLWSYLYEARNLRPVLTPAETVQYNSATTCYLCGKIYSKEDPKVRDHNHAAPYEYRGAAHRSCNLRYREQRVVNCYFHNLSNYDAHFIVRELAVDSGDVDVLPNTEEKYISFSKRFLFDRAADPATTAGRGKRQQGFKVRFLDTYRFLTSSLASLASALPPAQLTETRKRFPDDHLFNLVRRKGVFPYNFVTSHAVLEDTTELPAQRDFKNDMTLEDLADADYEHARNVWEAFGCRNLKDYAEKYLRCDIALLTDVFERFRDKSIAEYELDPAHYYTLPSYAWDVMLRSCRVELHTIQDFDMYLFFEQGIRGGISQAITRYAKANHAMCRPEDRRPEEPTHHLLYVDANNLYGWAMSQCLPQSHFEWLSREEIDALDIASLDPEGAMGYVMEVDLRYPEHLHNLHSDLPYCCETKRPPGGKFEKLVTTLDDKKNYICHYRVLQQALENGLELVNVNRVISFRQSRWLESYILMNTELRKKAKTQFDQDFFKLMNNAVFGKTIENVRKRINCKLVCTPEMFRKYVAKSNFMDRTYFNNDVAIVHMSKVNIVLDKPLYVGMCVLDLSKWLMYDFLRKMKNRYGDRLKVDYMDTDSFVFDIQTEDVYRDMLEHLGDFDTSSYPRNHPCYSPVNAKVIGKFKDECSGLPLLEYLGLRSKLYFMDSLKCEERTEDNELQISTVKRAKGVARGVVKNTLTTNDYRECLFNKVLMRTVNTRFQSRNHIVFTVQVEKLSLSYNDDKRYILPDGINTLPWGHKDIPPQTPELPEANPQEEEDEEQ